MLDPTCTWLARGVLAGVFLAAALHKVRTPHVFRGALADYRLLPPGSVPAVASALPALEFGVATGLCVPATARGAAFAAIAMLLLYSIAIAWNLARGRRDIDCGCGGERQPLSPGLVARNVALIGLGVVSLLPASSRTWVWIDVLTLAAGLCALWLLYAATNEALAQAARQRELELD